MCKIVSGANYTHVSYVNSKIRRKNLNVGGCLSAREVVEIHSAVSII